MSQARNSRTTEKRKNNRVPLTFLPPGEQVSGGGVLVILSGLDPQLDGDEPRILDRRQERQEKGEREEEVRTKSRNTLGWFVESPERVCSHLWISITSSAIMRPILPAPARVPPGMPGTVWRARFPPPAEKKYYYLGGLIMSAMH